MTYDVHITREDKAWLANVTNLDGAHTYAHSLHGLMDNVSETIRLVADLADAEPLDISITYEATVPREVRTAATLARRRERLASEQALLARDTEDAVTLLVDHKYSVRDIAAAVGITHGRVSQISRTRATA